MISEKSFKGATVDSDVYLCGFDYYLEFLIGFEEYVFVSYGVQSMILH